MFMVVWKMQLRCHPIAIRFLCTVYCLEHFLDAAMARAHQFASGWLMLSRLVAFAS
jgi:hypothetical protein